jgi:hypothetical protein
VRPDDGDCAGRLHGRPDRGRDPRHNHIHLETDQLGGEVGEAGILPVGVAVVNNQVLPLYPAEGTQALQKGLVAVRVYGRGGVLQVPYAGDLGPG